MRTTTQAVDAVKRPGRRRAFVVLTAVLLVYVGWEATMPNPGGSGMQNWDKVLHFCAFCALAVSWALAMAPTSSRSGAWVVTACLLAYGAGIEMAQAFIPGRDASVLDWLADAAGIAAGLAVVAAVRRLPALQRLGPG